MNRPTVLDDKGLCRCLPSEVDHRLAEDRMEGEHELQYGPFRVDLKAEQVWRGTEAVHLRPKSFAVLRCLVEQAGFLVSKDTLLQAVWPETVGSEAALTICIGELRRALGDTAQAPQFIQTVPRRGFRFIGPITPVAP